MENSVEERLKIRGGTCSDIREVKQRNYTSLKIGTLV